MQHHDVAPARDVGQGSQLTGHGGRIWLAIEAPSLRSRAARLEAAPRMPPNRGESGRASLAVV